MDKRPFINQVVLTGILLLNLPPAAGSDLRAMAGVDTGADAITLAASEFSILGAPVPGVRWVRLRGIDAGRVAETRAALGKLRAAGLRTCVLLRLSADNWKTKYLPEDLREAHAHGRQLGAAYGDLVDAWEVDNEPDLGFVPESPERYAAFLKAMYLGLKAGRPTAVPGKGSALVIMGALGLPPGPWLDRFAANDGLAYTDGFNYHYYGYAEDFTGVYQQHEAAVRELTDNQAGGPTASAAREARRDFPIFMTEIGYGMLGKDARDTKEGRLRQWRWFQSVARQVATLRPEAPLAFYLPPFLEYATSEFGLTVQPRSAESPASGGLPGAKTKTYLAGGIHYAAMDFGSANPEPWMERIGEKIGGHELTPAGAGWLSEYPMNENPSTGPRPWAVTTPAPSPVVIDFLPGAGLLHVKRYHGHFVTATRPVPDPAPDQPPPEQKPPPVPQAPAEVRSEEFIVQVRADNGNLYEVYPTRQATPTWQHFLEPRDNFTMSFYGRASLPWRFRDNRPASLVIVMYPKRLPATYHFRRPQLLRFPAGTVATEPAGAAPPKLRYGQGMLHLYNFSDQPVRGRLELPDAMRLKNHASASSDQLTLQPGERREIPVAIQVPADHYGPVSGLIRFRPETAGNPASAAPNTFQTSFIPDIAGMNTIVAAKLLSAQAGRIAPDAPKNRALTANRSRATEEAPMTEQPATGAFAPLGTNLERTDKGFSVTITALPPGKHQRVEVEIPWPDGSDFGPVDFLSLEFRLHP